MLAQLSGCGGFDIVRDTPIDVMHVTAGVLGNHLFRLLKGKREKAPKKEPKAKGKPKVAPEQVLIGAKRARSGKDELQAAPAKKPHQAPHKQRASCAPAPLRIRQNADNAAVSEAAAKVATSGRLTRSSVAAARSSSSRSIVGELEQEASSDEYVDSSEADSTSDSDREVDSTSESEEDIPEEKNLEAPHLDVGSSSRASSGNKARPGIEWALTKSQQDKCDAMYSNMLTTKAAGRRHMQPFQQRGNDHLISNINA